MFAARVDDAMKSSGRTKKSTGVAIILLYSIMNILLVNGGIGLRGDDRRDGRAWKQGIWGVAEHWRGRRRFFYSVTLSNIQ